MQLGVLLHDTQDNKVNAPMLRSPLSPAVCDTSLQVPLGLHCFGQLHHRRDSVHQGSAGVRGPPDEDS